MRDKPLVICFLFLFLLASIEASAQWQTQLLTFYEEGLNEYPSWQWSPEYPASRTNFDTGTLFTLNVPPCKRSEAIVFEVYEQVTLRESNVTTHLYANIGHWLKFISNTIPDNIEVRLGFGLCGLDSPQDRIRPVLVQGRQRRVGKTQMRRNKVVWMEVSYKDTGERLPDEQAIPIINNLIDNGFDIEGSFQGAVEGVRYLEFLGYTIYISHIWKK